MGRFIFYKTVLGKGMSLCVEYYKKWWLVVTYNLKCAPKVIQRHHHSHTSTVLEVIFQCVCLLIGSGFVG